MTSTQKNIQSFFQTRRSNTRASIKNIQKGKLINEKVVSSIKRKRDDVELTCNKRRKDDTSLPNAENTIQHTDEIINHKQMPKKKLSPEDLKAVLGKCNRLDELRSRLVKATKCSDRLKAFQNEINEPGSPSFSKSPTKKPAHPQLSSFSSVSVEVTLSPTASPLKSPLKTPVKTPAHLKYADLALPPSKELKLPVAYQLMKRVFISCDRIVSMLYNRLETITFSKLRTNVQEAMKKAFQMNDLGQIKYVFPNAYRYVWEKIKGSGLVSSNENFELVIQPNLERKEDSVAKNLANLFDDKPTPVKKAAFRKMDNVILIERGNLFHNSLLNILKQHHQEFLKTLDPPVEINSDKLKRWHPGFLQANIPQVEVSELPKAPVVETINSAKGMLEKARDVFSVNPRLLNAVEDAASKEKIDKAKEGETIKVPTQKNPALKGISSSLLAKIRAREVQKTATQMTRSKEEMDQLERLSRLPEVARIIWNIFISENKAALTWDFVSSKLATSHSSLISPREVDVHLNLLMKEVPNWCTVHKIRTGTYLKIDKKRQLNDIADKLKQSIKNQ